MINDLSTYTDELPSLVLPVTITQKETKQYLGNRYHTSDINVTLSYSAKNQDELTALHEFWRVDCLNGSKPFILELDILGLSTTNKFGVKWVGNFIASKTTGLMSTGNITLLVLYAVNENNELIEISEYN